MNSYRFNLITHGLMAIWQEGQHLHILVPDEPNHQFKMGSPYDAKGNLSINNLQNMPTGTLTLVGVKPGQINTPNRLSSHLRLAVLDKKHFQVNKINGALRTEFIVPFPDKIRSYCGAEVNPLAVVGTTPGVTKAPYVVEEVLALSWENLDPTGTQWKGKASYPIQFSPSAYANFGIYAQEASIGPLPHNHANAWNRMFTFGKNQHPDMNLSFPGIKADRPPVSTAIGISKAELDSLIDLAALANVTDRMGCGLAAFLEF
ncbi:MAG: hypothetical protein K7J46_12435 [Bryobacter sp.]|jgi:hypothetical protein|nr:hypothetical protein [Bryobacter sp. CoA8 C33]